MRASRKDYDALVDLIRHMEKGKTRRIMWAIAISDLLHDSNPLFDRKKFIAAVDRKEGAEHESQPG